MAGPVYHATERDLPTVRRLIVGTFAPNALRPGPLTPYLAAENACDPSFRPAQYIFRRDRKGVVSALKLTVRELHHPSGPVKVTLIGGVCTRPEMRRRGLVGPVIRESLAYSKRIRAAGQIIVTPIRDYYLRHGYTYFPSVVHSGKLPDLPARLPRVELLTPKDADWATELYNAAADGYGPIMRTAEYMRKWVLEMRLLRRALVGLKLLNARRRPAAYLIAEFSDKGTRIHEAVSRSRTGRDEALLLAHLRTLNRRRFTFQAPDSHPLVRCLRRRQRVTRKVVQRFMYYPLKRAFPVPDETFSYSMLDMV